MLLSHLRLKQYFFHDETQNVVHVVILLIFEKLVKICQNITENSLNESLMNK